jgi:hypothetical protein
MVAVFNHPAPGVPFLACRRRGSPFSRVLCWSFPKFDLLYNYSPQNKNRPKNLFRTGFTTSSLTSKWPQYRRQFIAFKSLLSCFSSFLQIYLLTLTLIEFSADWFRDCYFSQSTKLILKPLVLTVKVNYSNLTSFILPNLRRKAHFLTPNGQFIVLKFHFGEGLRVDAVEIKRTV